MIKTVFLSFFSICFLSTHCLAQQPKISWINAHAVAIDSSHSKDYLSRLASQLKDNEIVGLAEASHGTQEFFAEKNRIIMYLISKGGYRSVGFEMGYSIMARINDYIITGKGNLKTLMNSLHLYNTREFYDLFNAIKNFNEGRSETNKISVFGFDTDFIAADIAASAKYCQAYLLAHPDISKNAKTTIEVMKRIDVSGMENLSDLSSDESDAIASMNDELRDKQGDADFKQFKKRISLLHQQTQLGDPLARDKFMAGNIADFQQENKGRIIIWSHNIHLAKDTTMSGYRAMGYYLRQQYQHHYYALGFDTYKGSVTILNDDQYEKHTFEAGSTSLSAEFAKAKYPAFFIPFKDTKDSPFYGKNGRITNIYSNWGNNMELPIRPGVDFDGMIFIRGTTASLILN